MFSFAAAAVIFDQKLIVFPSDSLSVLAAISSRPHEIWAAFFGSTLEDRLVYTPSDCFETFPFPNDYKSNIALEQAGKAYCDSRAELMIRSNEGLTTIYNRFHNPNETSDDIRHLRELHDLIDRLVLDLYGWQTLKPTCDFFPEFDEDDQEEEDGRIRRKGYRYRWSDEIHDDVLSRLLNLNRQRAQEEGQLLATDESSTVAIARAKKRGTGKSKRGYGAPTNGLFVVEEEEA